MDWNLIGHSWAVNLLKEHVARGHMRHAYLITGPQGVGRRTLALRFAQALNCPQPVQPGQSCFTCSTCRRIMNMTLPDLNVVQAELVGGTLRVDQIRELQHSLALSPYESRYRIALILRFEEAHPSAANALLKTLEEPSPQVILLLTAESSERVLPTIASRCEILRLRPQPMEIIQNGLQTLFQMPEERARLLAQLSGGRPGYAIRLSEHSEELEQRQKWIDDLLHLLSANRVERFAYAEALEKHYRKSKEEVHLALNIWLSFWRDVLLTRISPNYRLNNADWSNPIAELSNQLGIQTALQVIGRIEATRQLLDQNVNARLALEVLMLDLPRW